MTTSAWVMLAVTWTLIALVTGRLFWKVLKLPLRGDEAER